MAIPLLGVFSYLLGDPAPDQVDAEQMLRVGWGNFALMLTLVVLAACWIQHAFGATPHDLGLPTSGAQLVADVRLGIVAALAALLPIYALQLTLITVLQIDTPHPLVEQIQQHNSPAMLLLGLAMAVVAAPLFEEFVFRGLLQGWLERAEDTALGYPAPCSPLPSSQVPAEFSSEISTGISTEIGIGLSSDQSDGPPPRPPRGWLPCLPHGWTPILISSLAFGLAHLGHGVAPVSLVLFGVVLGYLYQRTHRLAPSMTAHLCFNAHSMLMLWLQLDALPPS
jgi:membrane protease YdiL (CAAX protease family)